ncbi:MAG: biopolymer transporter ExbD [Alphaproteobacteria bacterium]|nr:biopolymer transporter ExbD [Alphaproteobacteria bacterium]
MIENDFTRAGLFTAPRSAEPEINLIPMINVVFLLLIFFLVSGTVEKMEIIPIDIPVASSGKMLDEGHVVVVLGSHDEVIVNDELYTWETLQETLNTALSENKERVVTIKADSKLPAKRMIDTMNMVKNAGGQNISLITQRVGP